MFDWPVIKLLLYIYENNGEVENFRGLMRELEYSFAKLDRSRRILIKYGLIEEEVIKGAPQMLKLKITEKGSKVAKLILNILEIMELKP